MLLSGIATAFRSMRLGIKLVKVRNSYATENEHLAHKRLTVRSEAP